MTAWAKRPEYPTRTVRYLTEGYSTLRFRKTTQPGRGLDLLCQLADLGTAVASLGPLEYQVILLCGLVGLTEEEAGRTLGVSQSTVSARYLRGLEMLKALLNGDD